MKLTRRALLQAAAAGAAIAPFLTRTSATYADSVEGPHRLLIIFTPNGPQFVDGPTADGGTETNFQLHDWWGPLARHKDDGVFFRMCHQPGVPFGDRKGDEYGHLSGTIGALTARTTEGTGTGTGPSLDQFIAQGLYKQGVVLPRRSVLWGTEPSSGVVFEAAGRSVTPTVNPYDALAELAPGFGVNGNAALKAALQRKHFVLDQSRADCQRLERRLDAQGRALLAAHCSNLEAVEAGVLGALQRSSQACTPPQGPISPLPTSADWAARENRDASLAAFTELLALAYTCDVTRVVTFQFAGGAARFAIPAKYNVPASATVDSGDSGPQMHAWTHNGGDPNHLAALKVFYNWYSEAVAKFIDKLKATPDANGKSLFDTTVVLWTSEFGAGNPHINAHVPIMLFGRGAGAFKTGRMFVPPQLGNPQDEAIPIHRLFVSLCRHAGLASVDSFGDHGTMPCGPLDWLRG